jgi:multidrug efflux pump subunit AcrB
MDFLIRRPIAVVVAFLAFVIIGVVAYTSLPISLLPDIAIPQITIQMNDAEMSSEELESSVVSPIRRQLLQVVGLEKIESRVRNGVGIISMKFEFGTNTDLAYIEVNEKIDMAMNSLPQGTPRPKAIKASATDIPVFYLNVSSKHPDGFMSMTTLVENVIRRRIEQLPEVAMADITGIPDQQLLVTPDREKLRTFGLTQNDIEVALRNNNIETSSMMVRDGYYQYTIRVTTLLKNADDVGNVFLRSGNRLVKLRDVCKVEIQSCTEQGFSRSGDRRVVTLAVIKQADESMEAMRGRIDGLVSHFERLYPDLTFEVSRNQTQLLDYTISNLKENLILGFLLIMVVALLFMGDMRSSIVIGISMLVSVAVTFVPFYFFGRSLNIVSLSGLILVVGMMIDNALIVTENISQWRQRGRSLRTACGIGTSEMITPLFSSSLTTVAVFVPLVYIEGMAGAMFSDQAFSIAAGLAVSYVVGIILLPVIYRQMFAGKVRKGKSETHKTRMSRLSQWYEAGYRWTFAHKRTTIVFALLTLPLCVLMFNIIDKDKMPQVEQSELTAHIEWNEEINASENDGRVQRLMERTRPMVDEVSAFVGVQDFIVDNSNTMTQTEAEIYWKMSDPDSVAFLQHVVGTWITTMYPNAIIEFAPPTTIFEKLFDTSEPDIEVQLTSKGKEKSPSEIREMEQAIKAVVSAEEATSVPFGRMRVVEIDREALQLHNVSMSSVYSLISNSMRGAEVTVLRSYSNYMPVTVAGSDKSLEEIIRTESVVTTDKDNQSVEIPLRQLVRLSEGETMKELFAGKDGRYIPLLFYGVSDGERFCNDVRDVVETNDEWSVNFEGSFFSSRKMLKQLIIILCISLLLMYFILCAQFESFKQPFIVLAEIPIDTAIGMFVLWACGETMNLMSGIGIIVACGIVINDSILKIDSINELRKEGMALGAAIHEAGRRRLRAIVMTSLTTIGAALPILFTSDMGSDIQRPLAIAMIATMTFGTLVSLLVIPLIYYIIEKRKDKNCYETQM